MKPSSKIDVLDILRNIEAGNIERRDIKLLLLELRDFTGKDSSLRDLASSIHQVRDQGVSFRLISKHINNFVDVALSAGTIKAHGIYSASVVIDELITVLERQGFLEYLPAIRTHSKAIILSISEFLDHTTIKVQNPYIRNCRLEIMENADGVRSLYFIFNFNQQIKGPMTLGMGMRVAMPFFT